LVAAALSVYVLECPEARADTLIGDTITANYLHDSTITASSNILVGSPFPELSYPGRFWGTGICAAFEEATTISIGALTIDLNENGGGTYGVFAFDGVDFTNLTCCSRKLSSREAGSCSWIFSASTIPREMSGEAERIGP
jgi:hypothetical protein